MPARAVADAPGMADPQPLLYVSYWSLLRRQTRREVFSLREQGHGVAAICRELGLSRQDVEAMLLSDRRGRSR